MMTPEEYLLQAERYRKALATAKDAFTRHHIEVMEQSYRTLAESERALRKAGRVADALDKLGNGGKANRANLGATGDETGQYRAASENKSATRTDCQPAQKN